MPSNSAIWSITSYYNPVCYRRAWAARDQHVRPAPQSPAHRSIRIVIGPDDIKDNVPILDQANSAQALLERFRQATGRKD
jgi:hypothetical protein